MTKTSINIDEVRRRIVAAMDYLDDMPSGCDHEADPENISPEDMTCHVSGLAWQELDRALKAAGGER